MEDIMLCAYQFIAYNIIIDLLQYSFIGCTLCDDPVDCLWVCESSKCLLSWLLDLPNNNYNIMYTITINTCCSSIANVTHC